MSGHDEFCEYETDELGVVEWCICSRLRAARADERARGELTRQMQALEIAHAEAVAARLVAVICDDAESEAWFEDSNDQLQDQITELIQKGLYIQHQWVLT